MKSCACVVVCSCSSLWSSCVCGLSGSCVLLILLFPNQCELRMGAWVHHGVGGGTCDVCVAGFVIGGVAVCEMSPLMTKCWAIGLVWGGLRYT